MNRRAGIDWATLPWGRGVRVVRTHPAGIVAVSKPAGLLSHPNRASEQRRALLDCRYDRKHEVYLPRDPAITSQSDSPQTIHLLNRLDSPTSGLLLLASDEAVADAVKEALAGRSVRKRYRALVWGDASRAGGTWHDRLQVSRKAGQVRTRATRGGGTTATTEVRCLSAHRGRFVMSLLEMQPMTGRSHQLRAQCAQRRLPIVGDATYGDFRKNRELARASGSKRLFLHSRSVSFRITVAGNAVDFSAEDPEPAEFGDLLEGIA